MFIVEIILIAYCFYFVSYTLFFAVGGLMYKKQVLTEKANYKTFAVLIPGYKEDAIILDTIKNNLKVDYPTSKFDLVIIADSFQEKTLDEIDNYPVIKRVVSFDKSTKVKALTTTISDLSDDYDYVVILDADNVMEVDYLQKVNSLLNAREVKALQTQRWPKNKNNELAVLDGVSEAINNHIYRQGAYSTGFSVSLAGSGMVFDRKLFQRHITQMESIGGFDRELEFRLLEEGIKVQYLKEALVMDQKTDSHKNFSNQRTRWVSSQYVYLIRFFGKGVSQLLKGDLVYFHSTVWRNIQLPRLINLGLLTILTVLSMLFRNYLTYSYSIWVSLWGINAFAMAISIPRDLYNLKLLKAVLLLPKLFLSMFLIMFKLKGANKKFIHTEHKPV